MIAFSEYLSVAPRGASKLYYPKSFHTFSYNVKILRMSTAFTKKFDYPWRL